MLLKIKNIINISKRAKISIKLTLVYAFMISLVLLILNAAVLFGVKKYIYNQGNKEINDIQTTLTDIIKSKDRTIDLSDKSFFESLASKEYISINILNKDRKIINFLGKLGYKYSYDDKKLKHIEDHERHLIYKNFRIQTEKNGNVDIQIIKEMHIEYNFMKILFIAMAAADFIGFIISMIIGYIISKRMLKPIDNITRTAEKISINNLKERIDIKGPDDELKRLANTFNNMLDNLQDAFNRQTQFVSDASHELRTPIAVIQGYANLLHRWGRHDEKALEKSIHGIKLESENIANLVEKLLFLAKGDSGNEIIEKKIFLLNDLIDEVVDESKMINSNIKILNSKNDNCKVLADYKMIKQLLRIFIDNSIKFTDDDGIIDISLISFEDSAKIIIRDNGIGIPKDEIKNIFERFYVVDKSRFKGNGGSGLGLSIARWIVDMHDWAIDVESEEGKYTKITVTLSLKI